MIEAADFFDECRKVGITFFTGTPCSYLKPLINKAIDAPDIDFLGAANEGDAVAMASGAWLAGKKSAVMFQNSGLGNAVNPLTSLSKTFKIPFLGIVTLRGEPGGPPDEPQHQLMGKITAGLLSLMEIPWDPFPKQKEDIEPALAKAMTVMESQRTPYFFLMSKGDVADYSLKALSSPGFSAQEDHLVARREALSAITAFLGPQTFYISTTGLCGRELFELGDSPNQFYMVGSMGCALPLGLGAAISRQCHSTPICVLDGDGALMMRMGAMTTVAALKPHNLIHILLDNGVHDSTGGQKSGSEWVRFSEMAKACGYLNILQTKDLRELVLFLQPGKIGPTFIHLKIKSGAAAPTGRPTLKPEDVALRFHRHVAAGAFSHDSFHS